MSAGCHILLRSGAELVTRADEARTHRQGGEFAEELRPSGPLDGLSDSERLIYEAFPPGA